MGDRIDDRAHVDHHRAAQRPHLPGRRIDLDLDDARVEARVLRLLVAGQAVVFAAHLDRLAPCDAGSHLLERRGLIAGDEAVAL